MKGFILALLLLLILLLVAADRAMKLWMTGLLASGPIVLIDGLLGLTYHENTGAAFGIFKNGRWVLIALTAVVIIGIVVYIVFARKRPPLLMASLVLLSAGGIGNLYDRVVSGYVVDYIELLFMDFPIFNLADILITTGAALFFIYMLFFDSSSPVKKKNNG